MAMGLLGIKVGMTQVFEEDGTARPVTVIQLGPCPLLQIRDMERDGYHAIQIGFGTKPRRVTTRAERGHVATDLTSKRKEARRLAGVQLLPKANIEPPRYIREYRLAKPPEGLTVGQMLLAQDVFKDVKAVDVTSKSKGHGFTGVMVRHNFGGLRASHGVKKGSRQRGSIASNASNRGSGRPKRGIRMAGQHGNAPVTVRNLKLVRIDTENNLMLVMGAIPGPNGGVVSVRATNKKRSKHYRVAQVLPPSAAKKAAAAKKKK